MVISSDAHTFEITLTELTVIPMQWFLNLHMTPLEDELNQYFRAPLKNFCFSRFEMISGILNKFPGDVHAVPSLGRHSENHYPNKKH